MVPYYVHNREQREQRNLPGLNVRRINLKGTGRRTSAVRQESDLILFKKYSKESESESERYYRY